MLPALGDRAEIRGTANLETVSNVTIRVVTSARVRKSEPWLGILAGAFHWVDCYFLLSRYQDEFARWSAEYGGEVIECHSYIAQREIQACAPDVVRRAVVDEIVRVWPELAGSVVHVEAFVNERTFDKQTVGHRAFQPPIETSVANLTLCGSWVRLDRAVHDMEKAVVTGQLAANRVLVAHGLRESPVESLRPHSMPAAVIRAAARIAPRPPGAARVQIERARSDA
jgi:isorenieratene synthase